MARPLARRTGGFPGVTLSGRPGRHLGRGGGILRKCEAHWWGPRTSNPVYLLNKGVGGFDSHALPPMICEDGGQHCCLLFHCYDDVHTCAQQLAKANHPIPITTPTPSPSSPAI